MMRLKLYVGALILSLGLFGCGGVDVVDEPQKTTFQGVLEEAGRGQYEVVTATGEKVRVTSVSIDLSRDEYLGNLVSVIGVAQEDESMELVGITVLEVLNPVKERQLVEFYDSGFGVKLSYYDDWQVKALDDAVVFTAPAEKNSDGKELDTVKIEQIPFSYTPESPDDDSKEGALVAFAKEYYPSMVNPATSINMIGSVPMAALKLTNEDVYFFYRNGLIYKVSYVPSVANFNETSKAVFGEMLRSFQFIGINDHGDEDILAPDVDVEAVTTVEANSNIKMTSFESLPYHFKANFPASWYYSGSLKNQEGVMHVYQFSDKPVDEGSILIELMIVSRQAPTEGQSINLANGPARLVENGSEVRVYLERQGQKYELRGDLTQKEIILAMASSIEKRQME